MDFRSILCDLVDKCVCEINDGDDIKKPIKEKILKPLMGKMFIKDKPKQVDAYVQKRQKDFALVIDQIIVLFDKMFFCKSIFLSYFRNELFASKYKFYTTNSCFFSIKQIIYLHIKLDLLSPRIVRFFIEFALFIS